MDLVVWVPLTVMLGLASFGILLGFIVACDKV